MTDRDVEGIGGVLVTGAGGFIGRHLTDFLVDSGVQVTALDLDTAPLAHHESTANCRLIRGTIEDPAARSNGLAGVDTVFHLAAAHLGTLQSVDEFRSINVEATRALAEESIGAGVRRFVHCSSVGVYGRIQAPPADEETPCQPEIPYEQTKLEGEREISRLAETQGLRAVILRPVWVYGPGCHRTEKLFRSIAANRFLVAGKGDSFRHCLYIEDMLTAFARAATGTGIEGEVFVIGDRQPVTIRHLVDQIARLTGASNPRSIPYSWIAGLAWAVEKAFTRLGKEPPISRRSLRFFTGNTSFSTSKAEERLGFSARFDLTAGLERTYEELRARGQKPTDLAESSDR